MGQQSSANNITTAFNLGGPSGPVESKSRWPGSQIRWPRANGPVLTTSLQFSIINKKAFQWNINRLLADSLRFKVNKFKHVPGHVQVFAPPLLSRMTDTTETLVSRNFVGGW